MPPVVARDLFSALSLVALAHTRSLGTSAELLEVNHDGSIREQKWYEKAANYGSRLVGRYQLRKDTKDAAVANALAALAVKASTSSDPAEKESYEHYGTQLDRLGYLQRFRDAKQRIEERNGTRIPSNKTASDMQIRRDSVASLGTQTSQPVSQVAIEPTIRTSPTQDITAVAASSVRDTQEFKDRVAVLVHEFGAANQRDFEVMIEQRMSASEGPVAASLSDAQYFAIKTYSSSSFFEMNAALRDPASAQARDPYVKQLNTYATSALKELAEKGFNYSGISNRGVHNFDFFINLLPNQTYTASAFTSTTLRASTAKNLADIGSPEDTKSTVIHTYGETGVDISSISDHPTEAEILYPPNSQFRVVFTGEHVSDLEGEQPGDPAIKKKVTYLVVEELNTPPQRGSSGIVSALDLATPPTRKPDTASKPAPSDQNQASGSLIGGEQIEDDDDAPPVDIDTFQSSKT